MSKHIIVIAYHESKNRVSYCAYAFFPPIRDQGRMYWTQGKLSHVLSFFELTSSPVCSVSIWLLYELLHQYQPEKNLNIEKPCDHAKPNSFNKMKKPTHPSISVGVSCLRISEGFGWVQPFFQFPLFITSLSLSWSRIKISVFTSLAVFPFGKLQVFPVVFPLGHELA